MRFALAAPLLVILACNPSGSSSSAASVSAASTTPTTSPASAPTAKKANRKDFPPFASLVTATATKDRYEATVDRLAVPPHGVAISFTVPALHVTRMYCEVRVSTKRTQPLVASLWRRDGTFVANAPDVCFEDSLPSPGTDCTRSVFCPASIDRADDFVLVVEPADADSVELSASVHAFDPHE